MRCGASKGGSDADADALAATFAQLQTLYRDRSAMASGPSCFEIWCARSGCRGNEQRADVLVGNPPWIVYRHLSAGMKDRLREALRAYELWVGGNLATQQDMCALFWARGAERYLEAAAVGSPSCCRTRC